MSENKEHWAVEYFKAVEELNERLAGLSAREFTAVVTTERASIKYDDLELWHSDFDDKDYYDDDGNELPPEAIPSLADYVWNNMVNIVSPLHEELHGHIKLLKIIRGVPSILAPSDFDYVCWNTERAMQAATKVLNENGVAMSVEEVTEALGVADSIREGDVEIWLL